MAGEGRVEDSLESEVFLQELHDALIHLRELPLRRGHPLCRRLDPVSSMTTAALQQLLVEAVERLRPAGPLGTDSPRSRRYRYLNLRYIEGARVEHVVADLGISDRQARREHRAALEELAALLLRQEVRTRVIDGIAAASDGERGETFAAKVRGGEDLAVSSDLEAELSSLEASSEIDEVYLVQVVQDALDLIAPLAAQHQVQVEFLCSPVSECSPRGLAAPTVLRQIFLNVLSAVVGNGLTRCLRVTITERDAVAEVHVAPLALCPTSLPLDHKRSPLLLTAQRLGEGQQVVVWTEESAVGLAAVHVRILTTRSTLVLLVDDNPGLVRLLRRYLQSADFRLVQARNAVRAMQLAQRLNPDVVILDLMMPVQDGWDVFRSLRTNSNTREIPIIACSVLPERELALSLGVNDFLAKPVTPESLLAALTPYRHLPAERADGETYQDRP